MDTAIPNSARSRRARVSYIGLLASAFSGLTGNAFTMLAIPLYVLATTGSATKTGIVAFVNTAPPIASAILGGPLIDRIGRKRTIVSSDILSLFTLASIPLLDRSGHLTFPLLLVIVALGSFFDPPGSNARQSMIPRIATEAGYSPEQAQSFAAVTFGMSQVIGPSLAGVSVAAIGAAGTIWINCVAFALSILAVTILVQELPDEKGSEQTHFREDLHEGWRFVWHDHFLRTITLISAAFSGIFVPIYTVLYPVYFTRIVHSERGLGLFIGIEALGGLLGALLYGLIGGRFSRRAALSFCLIAWLPTYWVLVFHPPLGILLIAGFLAGLITGPFQPIFGVAFQVKTPEAMRPRVYGLLMAMNLIAVPIGALVMGPLIQVAGIIPALVILASVISVLCIWTAFLPVLKEFDAPMEQVG